MKVVLADPAIKKALISISPTCRQSQLIRHICYLCARHEVVSTTVKSGARRDFTHCSTSGFLPARAALATTRCEAAETM